MEALPVANLIRPYLDPDDADTHDRDDIAFALEWLRCNPGRWALVGTRHYGIALGCHGDTARRAGMKVNRRKDPHTGAESTYACNLADSNPSLDECLKATGWHRRTNWPEDLPTLTRTPWPAELMATALAIARADLFPDAAEEEEEVLLPLAA